MKGQNNMIIIGGGFSEENLKRIAAEVKRSHYHMDMIAFDQRIREIFSKLGERKNKEIPKAKNRILTPDQVIEANILHRRVHEILNQPVKPRTLF
jgi:copper homeostasis protein CutC